MSQFKKFVQSPFFAATAGATALATVLLTPTFDNLRGAANGQNPTAPVASANPAPISEVDPLGIGTIPAASVPSAPAPNFFPNAAPSAIPAAPTAPGANDDARLAALRVRVQQLNAELRRVPTTDAEQAAQRQVVAELSELQAQIQQIEATAGQFAAYRRARDARAQAQSLGQGPFGASAFSGGYDGLTPNAANGFNALDRQGTSDASGLNGGTLQAVLPAPTLAPGEAEFLRGQKEVLTQQYRQLQQTIRALRPEDEALKADLEQEQSALLTQLKDVETRLASAPGIGATLVPNATAADALGSVLPQGNQLPLVGPDVAGASIAAKMDKASQAAALLREAGLPGLANCVATEVPRIANVNFVETQYVPGTWSDGSGLGDATNNPFQQISAKDVQGIQTSIDDLKTRVDALSETLSNVETQLKLLTRQTVAAPISNAAPSATEADAQTDAENVDAPPSDSEETPESLLGGSL